MCFSRSQGNRRYEDVDSNRSEGALRIRVSKEDHDLGIFKERVRRILSERSVDGVQSTYICIVRGVMKWEMNPKLLRIVRERIGRNFYRQRDTNCICDF